jgi:hypothetical protein
MSKAEMVTALTTPSIDVIDVPSGSYQIVKETGGRPVCQKKETAERLVDLLGDDMSSFNDVLTTASESGSQPDDKSLRTFFICFRAPAFSLLHWQLCERFCCSVGVYFCYVLGLVCSAGYRQVLRHRDDDQVVFDCYILPLEVVC